MNRRKSLKALMVGSVSAGVLLDACKPAKAPVAAAAADTAAPKIDRFKDEAENDKRLLSETFFTPEEMAAITILADIIIPADAVSGSASQAGVPAFIEFIVKDMPYHQTPMRGGLRWLNIQCLQRFGSPFASCTTANQMAMVDLIAWPERAEPQMAQGVAFFNLMRNLTASGFYTTEMGFKDMGYMGNQPN
ncbi:MAG: gluconate 2-dehydrogenase subunit 3 family protein, partial [Bacteroidetes bacterium]